MSFSQRVLHTAVYLALAGGAVFFCLKYWPEIQTLRLVRPAQLPALGLLAICSLWVNGIFNNLFYRAFNVRLIFSEWFGLSVVNTIGNLMIPFRGGAISNAVYLKKKHGFSYLSYISALSASYVMVFWVNSLVGIGGALLVWLRYGVFSWTVLAFLGCCFLSLSLVILFCPKLETVESPHLNRIIEAINAWDTIKSRRSVLARISLLALANSVIATLMLFVEFHVIGFSIPIPHCAVLAIFAGFSTLLSLTPGNLGIREAVTAVSGALVGVPIPVAVVASVIDRLATFIVSFLLGLYYSSWLLRHMDSRA